MRIINSSLSSRFSMGVNGSLTYEEKSVNWGDIFNLVRWDSNVARSCQSVDRLNEFEGRFGSIRKQMLLHQDLAPLIAQLNMTGIVVDFNRWQRDWLLPKQEEYVERYHKFSNESDVGGIAHARDLVQSKLGRKVSLEAQTLKQLANTNPLCEELLQLKRRWDFVQRFSFKDVEIINGRKMIFGTWLQNGSISGRLSCHNTNLLGLPKAMKSCFIPMNDHIVSIDLNAIQLRIAAALTNCTNLQVAFENGEDIHLLNGKLLSNSLGTDQQDDQTRLLGKKFAYMLMYGAGTVRFQELFNQFCEETVVVDRVKVAVTMFYIRGLDELFNSDNQIMTLPGIGVIPVMVELRKSQAVNLPIQSMESLLFKRILAALSESWKYLILPCHDELIFDVPADFDFESVETIMTDTLKKFLPKIITTNICKLTEVAA